jgi:hypothetical protein
MRTLYSVAKSQQAIRDLVAAIRDSLRMVSVGD